MAIDIGKLEKEIDRQLAKETKLSLWLWLVKKRIIDYGRKVIRGKGKICQGVR